MFHVTKQHCRVAILATIMASAPAVLAHSVKDEPLQSYRQSIFALIGANFGPIAAMVKGDTAWDQDAMEGYADDLEDIVDLDLLRGFAPGSEKGTTRAKPEIWDNMDDFEAKLEDLRDAAEALEEAAGSGDRKAIASAVRDTGGACKACHDEYKAKDYLY
ncbi:c-type cytochrome [Chromatocurvus halotolerans]|uniref:Cytochrome c556 n=1 Tax=Chromatocurvus halotolerans TaxID=1132028 RepID=A0A4R2KTN5_9GAMM|nr:cytochrome c [Chromatocurvus halotolerans]TCO77751.1 cytochrome c556 [Chromatocurvus halotolerans]